LSEKINTYDFRFEANSILCLEMRKAGKLRDLRKILHEIYFSIGSEKDPSIINQSISRLLLSFDDACI